MKKQKKNNKKVLRSKPPKILKKTRKRNKYSPFQRNKYLLRHYSLDRDHDGVPCENLCG